MSRGSRASVTLAEKRARVIRSADSDNADAEISATRRKQRRRVILAVVNVCAIADAQRSDEPTTPRTVIDAGESESVPVVADSVVHKRGGRCHLFPSRRVVLPLFRSGLLSLALPHPLFLAPIRAAYSRRQAKACTLLSTYSVRCAGVLSVRVYIKRLPAIRPYTPNHAAVSPRLRPSSASFSSLRCFLPSVRAKDATLGYNPSPRNSLVPHVKQ